MWDWDGCMGSCLHAYINVAFYYNDEYLKKWGVLRIKEQKINKG